MVDARRSAGRECPEEGSARSVGAPGPVLDEEELGRFVYRDDHVMADGLLTPAALPTSDLLDPRREGLSMGRLDHMANPDIQRVVAERERKTPANRFIGCGVAVTAQVRNLKTRDGRRELCVVDDARDEFDAHALMRLANPGGYGKGSVRRLRERLIDRFRFRPASAFVER